MAEKGVSGAGFGDLRGGDNFGEDGALSGGERAMAEAVKPSTIDSAITGWRDAFNALRSMPGVAGIAFVVMLAVNAAEIPLMPVNDAAETGLGLQFLSFALVIVQAFLLTPIAIAVHRYVLLHETTGRYALEPANPRFLHFFTFSIAVRALMIAPSIFMAGFGVKSSHSFLAIGLSFVLMVVTWITALRLVVVFPAIAVDAPSANWRNAMRDTKGHSWWVFFILVFTSLPFVIIWVPVYWLLIKPEVVTWEMRAIVIFLQSAVGVTMLAAYAAVASRLYRALADQLGRPPGVEPPASPIPRGATIWSRPTQMPRSDVD